MTPRGGEGRGCSALPSLHSGPTWEFWKAAGIREVLGNNTDLTPPSPLHRPMSSDTAAPTGAPTAGRADSPMTDREPQSRLWKSPQALVLQDLLQVRIP